MVCVHRARAKDAVAAIILDRAGRDNQPAGHYPTATAAVHHALKGVNKETTALCMAPGDLWGGRLRLLTGPHLPHIGAPSKQPPTLQAAVAAAPRRPQAHSPPLPTVPHHPPPKKQHRRR